MSVIQRYTPDKLFGGTWEQIESGYYLASTTNNILVGMTTPATNVGNTALTVAQMPAHTHIQNAHVHSINIPAGTEAGNYDNALKTKNYVGSLGNVSCSTVTATNQNTGGGQAHTHAMGTPATLKVFMWKRTA